MDIQLQGEDAIALPPIRLIQSSIIPTIKIVSDDTDAGFIIINASDFNASTMTAIDESESLPPIKKLAEFLAAMSDADAIAAMAATDERKSAAPIYAARLLELAPKP